MSGPTKPAEISLNAKTEGLSFDPTASIRGSAPLASCLDRNAATKVNWNLFGISAKQSSTVILAILRSLLFI